MRKPLLSIFSLLLGLCVLPHLNCERTILPVDSSQKIDYLQGNTTARVILKLFDLYSNIPLSGVKVVVAGVDSAKTDSSGTVVFDSVKAGNYLVNCSKNGFESSQELLTLSIDSNSSTVPVVNQSTGIFYMARKGVTLSGNLYFKKENTVSLADEAQVECRLTNQVISFQSPVKITTSADGSYSFEDLPEFSTYTITVRLFKDGSLFFKQSGIVTVDGMAYDDQVRAEDIILQEFSDGFFIAMDHNLEELEKNDSIKIDFSEAVDTDELGEDSIYIEMNAGSRRILTKNIWQNSNKTLVIVPYDGNWDPGEAYVLTIGVLKSTTGKQFDNTDFAAYSFTLVSSGALDDVDEFRYHAGNSDTVKADYNTSSITLLWEPLENATSYQIYQKATTDSLWYLSATTTDTTRTIATAGSFTEGNTLQFIVLGKNSENVSDFDDAIPITVKDETSPVIIGASNLSVYGCDNTSYTGFDTVTYNISTSYIPEPLDTTKAPEFSVTEGGYVSGSTLYGDTLYTVDPENCYWTWTTRRSGTVHVVIDPEENGGYDTLTVDFSSLTDLAGNEVDAEDDGGNITIFLRP